MSSQVTPGSAARPSTSRLVSAGALMAAGTMISRILGFVRVALLAFVLGNGTRQADMYSLATTIPTSLYILFAGGALNTVLVPQLVRAVKNDADGGEAYTNRILTAFLLLMAFIGVVLTVAAPLIIRIYSSSQWRAPELAAHYQSMILLAYLCLPEVFFYGVFFLLGQVLNARDRFGPMMWAPIANNVIAIAVLLVYLAVWGRSTGEAPFSTAEALLLGGGATFGIICQTLVMVVCLARIGFRYRPRFDLKGTGLGHTFHLAKWTLGFVLVNQLALIVVDRLATSATAGGSGAGLLVYNNAYLIWILPHSLVTISLATAMLPSASRMAAEGDLEGVRDETMRTLKLTTAVLLPAALAFLALADPMAHLMFGHGSGAQDARFVTWTLMAFAIGLVPFTVQYVCLRAFYALENTKTPFLQQCVIAGLNVVLAILLVVPLNRPELVAPGLALAYSLAYYVGVVISFRHLGKRLPGFTGKELLRHLGRVLIAVAPAALVAWLISTRFTSTMPMRLLGLVLAGVVALAIFFGLARLLKISEVTAIITTLTRRGRRTPDESATENKGDDRDEDPGNGEGGGRGDGPNDDDRSGDKPKDDERGPAGLSSDTHVHQPAGVTAVGAVPAAEARTTVMATVPDDADRTAERQRPAADGDANAETTVMAAVRDDAEDPTDTSGDQGSDGQDADDEEGEDTAEDVHPIRVKAGQELGGRYRLEEVLVRRASTQTWRAFDEVLSRPVLIHLLPPGNDNTQLMEAARKAAVATDSRFLRVLDAAFPIEVDQLDAEDATPGADERPLGPYIVCEYAPGQSLQTLLASGPLSALEAAWLVREVADALAGMHAQKLYHQRVSPDTVVITAAGNVKIVGLLLEAEMGPSHHALPHITDPQSVDVLDLGRLLYCTLVSRWPGGHAYGMAAAPRDAEGRVLTPRQVRAGVSPALDRICDQILSVNPRQREAPLRTAQSVVQALNKVLGTADAAHDLERRMRYPVPMVRVEDEPMVAQSPSAGMADVDTFGDYGGYADYDDIPEYAPPGTPQSPTTDPDAPTGAMMPIPPPTPQSPRSGGEPTAPTRTTEARRREEPLRIVRPRERRRTGLMILIGLILLALLGGLIAVGLNGAGIGSRAPARLTLVSATDFDPQGNDGRENADQVSLAYDGNPTTAWTTVSYREADMTNKDGLGVIFDLGEARDLSRVDLTLLGTGTDVEIRVPQADPTGAAPPLQAADQWRVVTGQQGAPAQTQLTVSPKVTTRYVLVYFTRLPADGSGYRGGIAEASFWG